LKAFFDICVWLSDMFRAKAFDFRLLLSKLLRNIAVGRFAFRVRVFLFKIENLLRHFNQRFIEYPWVLQQLGPGRGRILLDVGCSGTLLDHELLARGFRVVGLDIQDYTLRNSREAFVQANVLHTGLPSETFDVILLVSTIEHIGLDTYGQDLLDDDADFVAMQELQRLLKPDGVLILTTPYEGKGPFRIHRWGNREEFLERRYDYERLEKLLEGFAIVDSAFFLCMLKHRCKFIPIEKPILDELSAETCEGSLACLILRKKAD